MSIAEAPRPTRQNDRRLWTADEFQRMAKLGLFDDERLELIQGRFTIRQNGGGRHFAPFRADGAPSGEGLTTLIS